MMSLLSAAREEAAIVSTELISTARTGAMEGAGLTVRTLEAEAMNPIAIRHAAEAAMKETVGGAFPVSRFNHAVLTFRIRIIHP